MFFYGDGLDEEEPKRQVTRVGSSARSGRATRAGSSTSPSLRTGAASVSRKAVSFTAKLFEDGRKEHTVEVRFDAWRKNLHIVKVRGRSTPSKSRSPNGGRYFQVEDCVKVSKFGLDSFAIHFQAQAGKKDIKRIVSLRQWPREAKEDVKLMWDALKVAADEHKHQKSPVVKDKDDYRKQGSASKFLAGSLFGKRASAPPPPQNDPLLRRGSAPAQMPRGQGRRNLSAMRQRDSSAGSHNPQVSGKGAFASLLVGKPADLTDLAPKRNNVVKSMKVRKGTTGREREASRKALKASTYSKMKESWIVPSIDPYGSRLGNGDVSPAVVSRKLSADFDEAAESSPRTETKSQLNKPEPFDVAPHVDSYSLTKSPDPVTEAPLSLRYSPDRITEEPQPLGNSPQRITEDPLQTFDEPRARTPEPFDSASLEEFNESFGTPSPTGLNGEFSAITGVRNVGNTCYLAAVVQVILHSKLFIQDLRELVEASDKEAGLSCAILELADMQAEGKALCPKKVQAEIGRHFPVFQGTLQQDAHEFFTRLLDVIAEETASDIDECPVKKHFSLVQEQTVKCLSCDNMSKPRNEMYRDLSLDIPTCEDPSVIHELSSLINGYFQEETVELTCEKCKGKQASRLSKIALAPGVLVLHMKRFKVSPTDSDVFNFEKAKDRVRIPENMSLGSHHEISVLSRTAVVGNKRVNVDQLNADSPRKRPRLDEAGAESPWKRPRTSVPANAWTRTNQETAASADMSDADKLVQRAFAPQGNEATSNGEAKYALHSVIRHCSLSAAYGHYVTDIAQPGSKWICFDDMSVTEHEENEFYQEDRERDGYLLFYVRQ